MSNIHMVTWSDPVVVITLWMIFRIILLLASYAGVLLGTSWFVRMIGLAVREAKDGDNFYILLLPPGIIVLISLVLVIVLHRETKAKGEEK